MAEAELINEIVRQVVAALGRGGSADAPRPAAVMKAKAAEPRAAGKVFVTEAMFARRASSGGAVIELACNEFLTPAAADLAEDRHLTVTRAASPMIKAAMDSCPDQPTQNSAAGDARRPGAIGLMVYKADAKVASVVSSLGYDGLELSDYNVGECPVDNLRGLCDAVASGVTPAGIAILPYASDAMVLANKTRGVRAVQGTRVEAVAAAMRHFNANMLILEHAFSMFHEMRAMVRVFAAGQMAAAAGDGAVADAIDELERL